MTCKKKSHLYIGEPALWKVKHLTVDLNEVRQVVNTTIVQPLNYHRVGQVKCILCFADTELPLFSTESGTRSDPSGEQDPSGSERLL